MKVRPSTRGRLIAVAKVHACVVFERASCARSRRWRERQRQRERGRAHLVIHSRRVYARLRSPLTRADRHTKKRGSAVLNSTGF